MRFFFFAREELLTIHKHKGRSESDKEHGEEIH